MIASLFLASALLPAAVEDPPPMHKAAEVQAVTAGAFALPDVTAAPGELTLVDVSAVDADTVEWGTIGDAPSILPQYKPGATAPYGLAFSTNTAGKWWIVGAAVKGGKPFRVCCKVTVGTPPPGPGPGPTPTPSDLTKALQAAYDKDQDADKAHWRDYLQGVFIILAAKAPSHTEWHTNADATAYEKAVAEAPSGGMLPATDPKAQVLNLRKAIAATLTADLGDTTKPADLNAIAADFGNIAAALGAVK